VPSPNPATGIPGDSDVLTSISGTGPDDLWAAGWDGSEATQAIRLLSAHWNGTGWTAATSPTPVRSDQFASGITAISPGDVRAVGTDETRGPDSLSAHWNGKAWSLARTPELSHADDAQNMLTGVSAGDAWACGLAGNVSGHNFRVPCVLHRAGTKRVMTMVPSLGTGGGRLNGIRVLSAAGGRAAGQTQESNGAILTLTGQYNGTAWTTVPGPGPGSIVGTLTDNSLDAIATAAGSDLIAAWCRGDPRPGGAPHPGHQHHPGITHRCPAPGA
jgi:hypothetical protein